MKQILTQREKSGKWDNLTSFLQENTLSRPDFTAIAAANGFSVFGYDRRSAIWLAEAAPFQALLVDQDIVPSFNKLSALQEVQQDYAATGTSLQYHPSQLIKQVAWPFDFPVSNITMSHQFKNFRSLTTVTVFGMITCRQAPPTAKGVMFITLWDESGSINVIIKAPIYEKHHTLIDESTFLCVRGKLQCEGESRSLLASTILAPEKDAQKPISIAQRNYY